MINLNQSNCTRAVQRSFHFWSNLVFSGWIIGDNLTNEMIAASGLKSIRRIENLAK